MVLSTSIAPSSTTTTSTTMIQEGLANSERRTNIPTTTITTAVSRTNTTKPPGGVLYLKARTATPLRVRWSPDTVDNEEMGRKKSNLCCIYHATNEHEEGEQEHKHENHHEHESDLEKKDTANDNTGNKAAWNAYEIQPRCKKRL